LAEGEKHATVLAQLCKCALCGGREGEMLNLVRDQMGTWLALNKVTSAKGFI